MDLIVLRRTERAVPEEVIDLGHVPVPVLDIDRRQATKQSVHLRRGYRRPPLIPLMRNKIGDRHPVDGDGETFAPRDASHDGRVVIAQLGLLDDLSHAPIVAIDSTLRYFG